MFSKLNFIKTATLFLLFIAATAFIHQTDKAPDILWSKKKLSWSDFKKQPDKDDLLSKSKSRSYVRLQQDYFVTTNHQIHFTIAAWFVAEKSWVKQDLLPYSDNNFKSTLSSQQHFFNMTELFARQIRQALSNTVFEEATYQKQIPFLFERYYKQYQNEQKKYQEEISEYGQLKQNDWESSIDDGIKQLSKFADTAVVVKIH